MTSIFQRKGRAGWTLKFTDASGRERMRTFRTRQAAKDAERELAAAPPPGQDGTLKDYATRWLRQMEPSLRPGSLSNYEADLRNHILPELGHRRLRELAPGHVKDMIALKRQTLAKKTVLNIKATLHACLEEAVADGYLTRNPAHLRGRSRALSLRTSPGERAAKIKALTAEQLHAVLDAALERVPYWWLLFRVLATTGMRLGEGLALRWAELDLAGRSALVRRSWTRFAMQPTKSSTERAVDLSARLCRELEAWRVRQAADALQAGAQAAELVFPTKAGTPRNQGDVREAFKRALRRAGLPTHFSPHCLRHTYASLLLVRGFSVYYVSRQLGHASIQITVDRYGRWLPATNPGAADDLERAIEGGPVTADVTVSPDGGSGTLNTRAAPSV